MQGDPDWEPWLLGEYRPDTCGAVNYVYSNGQVVDSKRMAEKAYRSTRKFQVLHMHGPDERCADRCQVYGAEVPRLV